MQTTNTQELQDNDIPPSILRADIKLTGDLFFSGTLHIFGNITGNIVSTDKSNSYLVLEENASVDGEIRASNVLIRSKVFGNIFAFNHLSLSSESVVQGDVHYKELEMSEGATINGMLSVMDKVDS